MKLLNLILICMILLMSIGFSSAIDLDNQLNQREISIGQKLSFGGELTDYNPLWEKYSPLQVTNFFGLGETILEAKIDRHTESCSGDCASEINIILKDRGVLIEDIRWKKQVRGEWVDFDFKNYQLWIKSSSQFEERNIYETICEQTGTSPNGTIIQSCRQEISGTETVEVPEWTHYVLGTEVEAGNYEVKITGGKKPETILDWQIKTSGVWTDNWAVWGELLPISSSNLVSWWYMDETAGNVAVDSRGLYNLTINNATVNRAGKIETAFSYDRVFDYLNTTQTVGITAYPFTISLWANTTHSGDEMTLAGFSSTSNDDIDYTIGINTANNLFIVARDGIGFDISASTTSMNDGNFHHIVAVFNSNTDRKVYKDGVSILNQTTNIPYVNTNIDFGIGATISSLSNFWDGSIDEVAVWNKSLNTTEISALYNSGNGVRVSQGNVILNSPADNSISPINQVTTNSSATIIGGATLVNVTLYDNSTGTWGARNTTTITGTSNSSAFINTYSESSILWNHQYCDSDGDCGFAPANFTFSIDTQAPTISVTSPTALVNYGKLGGNLSLNTTITDTNLDKCWFNYNGTNTTITGCLTGVLNSTSFTLTNQKNLTVYANDTAGNINSSFVSWDYKVFENNRTYNTTAYETAHETYLINLTANNSLTAVNLLFNGTSFSMTNQGSGIWSYSRDLPSSVVGNNSVAFRFTYGTTFDSDLTYQDVQSIFFGLCNGTYTNDFLNLTFKDESDLSSLNATIPTSTFDYYLGTGTVTKTFQLINNTENDHYGFCASPTTSVFHIDHYVQYASSGYPQRIWNPMVTDYSSTVTNQILYLLSSADGIYVTFQVVNSADQLLENVLVTATRSIGGNDVEVGNGLTSAAGTVTLWLNPDFSHTFNFSKTGYTTFSYSDNPTQASYTIILTGGVSPAGYDYSRGISYSIFPRQGELVNDTVYNFNYTLTSSFWDVSSFGFSLRLINGTVLNSTSLDDNGGVLSVLLNTENYTRIIMDYYYTINSTNITGTTYWNVLNSENTQWSIKNFFTDLNAYMDSGLFGIDNFGRYLIIFIVLFISVGVMSYKYGLSSPLSVVAMIFAVVFFFDVVLGLLPTPINAIPHSLTYLALLILIALIIKESQQ